MLPHERPGVDAGEHRVDGGDYSVVEFAVCTICAQLRKPLGCSDGAIPGVVSNPGSAVVRFAPFSPTMTDFETFSDGSREKRSGQ